MEHREGRVSERNNSANRPRDRAHYLSKGVRYTAHAMTPSLKETPPADRLLGFREVNRLVGSACKTSHTARNLARRGLIRAVRVNERFLRFSEASVLAFIRGQAQ